MSSSSLSLSAQGPCPGQAMAVHFPILRLFWRMVRPHYSFKRIKEKELSAILLSIPRLRLSLDGPEPLHCGRAYFFALLVTSSSFPMLPPVLVMDRGNSTHVMGCFKSWNQRHCSQLGDLSFCCSATSY